MRTRLTGIAGVTGREGSWLTSRGGTGGTGSDGGTASECRNGGLNIHVRLPQSINLFIFTAEFLSCTWCNNSLICVYLGTLVRNDKDVISKLVQLVCLEDETKTHSDA